VIRWIESIPTTFWGVLAGSFFTLIGVWFTNRAYGQRLERQLQHERQLKSEERELALKRDVYLPAAEAVSAGMVLVGRLADLSMPQEKLLDDWMARSPAIARANLVASDRTLEALSRFHASLSSKLLGFLGVRMRLTIKATERQSMMDEVNRLTAEKGNLVALLQQMSEDGSTDAARRAAVKHDFEVGQKRVGALLEQHDKLNRQLLEEQLRFGGLCNQAVAELGQLVTPLLASARAELALPFDAGAYARIIREAQESAAVDLEGFFEELRSIVKDA
jgi:hypothetical protein